MGKLPKARKETIETVLKEIKDNGKAYFRDLLLKMNKDNNYLANSIFIEGEIAKLDYNPSIDAEPEHLVESAYLIYGILEREAKTQEQKLPFVSENIDLLIAETEDDMEFPERIMRKISKDNPLLLGIMYERAKDSKDEFKELYCMARVYRLLEVAAEYEEKGLNLIIPEQQLPN